MKYRYITVEGVIGAGKTTLAHLLAERLGGKLILEEFAENPFLAKFYENPGQFAFPVELFFMAERYKQLKDVQLTSMFEACTVSDYMFIKSLLFAKTTLAQDEFALYKKLFDIIHQQLVYPDLLIYLHSPVDRLQRNIKTRGRTYEQKIPDDYLLSLQDTYLSYLKQHPVRTLFVDASNADFLHRPEHLAVLLQALDQDWAPGQHLVKLPE